MLKAKAMDRRNFLQNSAVVSTGLMVPTFLTRCSKHVTANNSVAGKKLVVIQLSGGNDGLNTFVPYSNDIYYRKRPTLAIPKNKVIKVSSEIGLNPVLTGLSDLFDRDLMTVINSVGYPNASRSHFKSMDVWHSAGTRTTDMQTGWIGRYLDSYCSDSMCAMEITGTPSLALLGKEQKGFCLSDPSQLNGAFQNEFVRNAAENRDSKPTNKNVDFLYKELAQTRQNASAIVEKIKTSKNAVSYPASKFAQRLQTISQLMTADLPTKIFYASLSGFDTHVRQTKKHTGLLTDLSTSLSAFVNDLKAHGLLKDTLIMVFSEFGRRTKENANKGTDHGKGNNVFFIGTETTQKGFYGTTDLNNLDEGDVRFHTDFRSIYSTVLNRWLDVPAEKILGQKYPGLPIL